LGAAFPGGDERLPTTLQRVVGAYRLDEQPVQEGAEQEEQEEPAPAMTPVLPMVAKSEIRRRVSRLLHLGQATGASACAIERRASKDAPHWLQRYS